jgi:hypothetical protein|tara:strand:+ start:446 stop:658 length:213 start_codon:yes stop_codon:yes gene_type:complete
LTKEELLLKAAIELNPKYIYEFKKGTLGPTLYVRASSREEARIIRKEMPGTFEGYQVIVTYLNIKDEILQ